jgi:hypothetical protein
MDVNPIFFQTDILNKIESGERNKAEKNETGDSLTYSRCEMDLRIIPFGKFTFQKYAYVMMPGKTQEQEAKGKGCTCIFCIINVGWDKYLLYSIHHELFKW